MSADVHVRVRRLSVPAPEEGEGPLRVRDVIEAIERHVLGESRESTVGIEPAVGSTANRIGKAVGHSVRATLAAQSGAST